MKKFFSLIVIILSLVGTWKMIENEPEVDFETHSSIQLKFAEMIEEALTKHRPHFQNLKILKIWTEGFGENKVKAHYQYSFFDADTEDPQNGAEQTIKGEAILKKENQSTFNDSDTWLVEKVQTQEGVLIFQEGSLITPESASTNSPAVETPAAEKTQQ